MPASHDARQVRKDAKITAKVVPDAELKVRFDECDVDGGATICLAEFTALLGGDPEARQEHVAAARVQAIQRGRLQRRALRLAPEQRQRAAAVQPGTPRASPSQAAPAAAPAPDPAPARHGAHGSAPYQLGSTRGMARAAAAAEGGGRPVELRKKFQAASYGRGGQDWHALFGHYDRDGSGELEFEEFRRAVRRQSGTPRASSVLGLRDARHLVSALGDTRGCPT